MTYTDPRSKHQIALYKTHEIFAAREWNMKNANRWNEHRGKRTKRSEWVSHSVTGGGRYSDRLYFGVSGS